MGSLFNSGLSPSKSNGDLVKRRTFCPQLHETLVVIERPPFSQRRRRLCRAGITGKPFPGVQDSYSSTDGADAPPKFRRDRKTRLAGSLEFEKPLVGLGGALVVAVRGHNAAVPLKRSGPPFAERPAEGP